MCLFTYSFLSDGQVWWLPLWLVESLALSDHQPGSNSCWRSKVSNSSWWLEIGAHCSWACLKVRPALQECKMDFLPREVLKAMQGFIEHFFGCRECARWDCTWKHKWDQNLQHEPGISSKPFKMDKQLKRRYLTIKLLKNNLFYPSYNFKGDQISSNFFRWKRTMTLSSSCGKFTTRWAGRSSFLIYS